MVSTRSMAGKPEPDESENAILSLRKKPIRRATAKTAASASASASQQSESSRSSSKASEHTATRATRKAAEPVRSLEEPAKAGKPTRKAAEEAQKARPLSPKKITQVAKARPITRQVEQPKKADSSASARPKRPLRTAAAAPPPASAPAKAAAKSATKAPAARGRPRKVQVAVEEEPLPTAPEEDEIIVAGPAVSSLQDREDDEAVTRPTPARTKDTPKPAPITVRKTRSKTPSTSRSTRSKTPATYTNTRSKTPQPQDDVQKEPEDDLDTAQPPATVSKAPRASARTPTPADDAAEDAEETDQDVATPQPPTAASTNPSSSAKESTPIPEESDDELCGAKTPMRRAWSPAKSAAKPVSSTSSDRGRTPARRPLFGAHAGTPQTQKLPHRAPLAASPQRPMTVSRGLSKPMVFRPLPRPDELNTVPEPSPSKLGRLQEHAVDESSISGADTVDHGQDESIHVMEDGGTEEQDDVQEHNLDEPESEDELQRHEYASAAGTDDEDELLDAPNDNLKEPTYEDEALDTSEEDISEMDSELDPDDETLVQPRLPIEALHSSPLPAAPDVSDDTEMDATMSDLQSSPTPSTPGSVIVRNIAEVETPTQDQSAPVPRLSVIEESSVSDINFSDLGTPEGPSRMSFNTANARMLQTPHMRAFRESSAALTPSLDTEQVDQEPLYSADCIDPALLSTQEEMFDLAQEADILAGLAPEKLSPTLRAQAETLQPASAIPGRLSMDLQHGDGSRLSMLVESLVIAPAEHMFASRASLDPSSVEQPAPIAQMVSMDPAPVSEQPFESWSEQDLQMNIDLAETLVAVSEDCNRMVETGAQPNKPDVATMNSVSSPSEPFPRAEEGDDVLATPAVPRYAQPTVTSEARRKSMSSFNPVSPQSSYKRPATAGTTIKPVSSEAFAKLWAAKEESSKTSRRSSIRQSGFGPIAQCATPKSAKAKTPLTERSETRSTRIKKSRMSGLASVRKPSIQLNEEPVTPEADSSGPKPRKHTPSLSLAPTKTPRRAPRTPMKTPLKAPGVTPGGFPMTPHPSQPLKSVTALVEIFTLDGSSASGPFIALLQRLGARTTKVWSERVTHVVFKDGSPATLQKVRLANKELSEGQGREIFCVNSRWVTDCDKDGARMDERSEEYAVDVDDAGTKSKAAGRHRRRKSMEPASLKNIDGNVVATDGAGSVMKPRRGSLSRKSMARVSLASTFWGTPGMSPIKGGATTTPFRNSEDRENAFDAEDESFWNDEGSSEVGTPVLPGYMNRQQELEMLQRTAPVNRMKKLRLKGEGESRRLTFFDGRD